DREVVGAGDHVDLVAAEVRGQRRVVLQRPHDLDRNELLLRAAAALLGTRGAVYLAEVRVSPGREEPTRLAAAARPRVDRRGAVQRRGKRARQFALADGLGPDDQVRVAGAAPNRRFEKPARSRVPDDGVEQLPRPIEEGQREGSTASGSQSRRGALVPRPSPLLAPGGGGRAFERADLVHPPLVPSALERGIQP